MPNRSPKRITPSQVARYYFLECDRYLRFTSTPAADRDAERVPEKPVDPRPATAAILEGGYEWEETVVRRLGDAALISSDATPLIRDRVFDVEATRAALASLTPGRFLYQPTLRVPDAFYRRFGLDRDVVRVSDCRPDLIGCTEVDGRRTLRVVDVKAAPGLKLSHRVQATLYTIILAHVVEEWGLKGTDVAADAGIWLGGSDEPVLFDIRMMRPPLEEFLERDLQPILDAPAEAARWHVYFRCEWCEFFDHCRAEMRRTDSVSRVPNLTVYGRRYLSELDPPVDTVSDLESVLASGSRAAALDHSASLGGRVDRLRAQVRALRSGSTQLLGGASLAMPRRENCRIVFTVQTEPVSGQVYAFGLYAMGFRDVIPDIQPAIAKVAPTPGAADIGAIERSLVRELHRLLTALHTYNIERTGDWPAQKTLQVYTFDSYEHELLIAVLSRRLLDPEVAAEALAVFFHFQRPELAHAPEHPSSEVFFPLVILTRVVRDLFALPLEVTYRFADTVNLLRSSKFSFEYVPNELFSFELSNQLRSEAIFAAWHAGEPERLAEIEAELKARTIGASGLVNGIREHLGDTGALFAHPPRFALSGVLPFRHPVLSRLAFIARYEGVVGYLGIRERRTTRVEEKLHDGASLAITYDGNARWVLDPRHRDHVVEATAFPDWLLVPDTDDGRRASLAYDDYRHRSAGAPSRDLPVAFASIAKVEGTLDEPNLAVELEYSASPAFPRPVAGLRCLLEPRFKDANTGRVIEELHTIDAEDDPSFVRLLEGELPRAASLPDEIRAEALVLGQRHGMTTSQLAAFEGILDNGQQLVWGPPGTGKTHFLALAILCLAAAHASSGRPFRVLVTAFTHAAIDNCLSKLAAIQRERDVVTGGIPVAKLKRMGNERAWGVEVVSDLQSGRWFKSSPICVLGGTVWSIQRQIEAASAQCVVIDEGSQLRVPEAAIAIRRLREDGRLVIAGDHRQLPPIVQGVYPDAADGSPPYHRSIFECLRSIPAFDGRMATLLENFRMNRTLTSYPASQIYVSGYDSATPAVADRRLRLGGTGVGDLLDRVIDPDYPLVVGVLGGSRGGAENRVEADLVARVALRLRERLLDASGALYGEAMQEDGRFWRDGLFVVSPHHAQINAIQLALRAGRSWGVTPFVDTVDKMQGQECDAVMTSYGVADVEYAVAEKEFIYSLNRLNVAITRARAKSIVFLSRQLLEPPLHVYEDDATAEGVSFMQGLVQFAAHHGESATESLPSGQQLTLHRLPATFPGEPD